MLAKAAEAANRAATMTVFMDGSGERHADAGLHRLLCAFLEHPPCQSLVLNNFAGFSGWERIRHGENLLS
ncbi:hypothetical protein D7V97_36885 [Corallococcus sp. CA053C]|nr:hypothetical protein D7V97_36885 [Corallococcus sp. CA053C]